MILVVDDNPAIREMLEAILSSSGYEVRCATSGEDALARMERKLPDLVLLDLTMPGMSGYRTVECVRERFPDDDIPIVLISAYPPDEERERAMRMGVVDYICKPFQIHELLQCVQTCLAPPFMDNAGQKPEASDS